MGVVTWLGITHCGLHGLLLLVGTLRGVSGKGGGSDTNGRLF